MCMKYYIIITNIITFILYCIDKIKAIKNKRRISEKTLCFFTLISPPIGALLGMYIAHHKTRKIKFHIVLIISLIIWYFILKEIYL